MSAVTVPQGNAEAVQGFGAGWREFQAAWLLAGFHPGSVTQGSRELSAELAAEVRPSDATVHAGEPEHPAGRLRGQLDSELGEGVRGRWAEFEFPFAGPGLKRS